MFTHVRDGRTRLWPPSTSAPTSPTFSAGASASAPWARLGPSTSPTPSEDSSNYWHVPAPPARSAGRRGGHCAEGAEMK
ncbi:unnamed protein product [Protopolystoma xenopodis]|uniref:Uncharacterized protein n=1 Tax=Protopolystoma xenopodis TaxID=117903 RepID=A0A448WML2_9PLAT|nr:unnamed protein product [Protopolystoma xenopodis]